MKQDEKGIVQVLLVIGIVVLLTFIGYMLYVQNIKKQVAVSAVPSPYQVQYQQAGKAVTPINDTSGLNSAASTLDTTDTSQLDANLKALDSASAGF